MPDDADRADQEIERGLAEALRLRKPQGPAPTGRCLYCDEGVIDSHRWCGPLCRNEWERLDSHRALVHAAPSSIT